MATGRAAVEAIRRLRLAQFARLLPPRPEVVGGWAADVNDDGDLVTRLEFRQIPVELAVELLHTVAQWPGRAGR